MLAPGQLGAAFEVYWSEMDRCRAEGLYWSLLHVTICLPDICAALQSDNGETSAARYTAWCDQHLPDSVLSGAERYRMRCKVLHQGRASTDQPGRYTGFSLGQPASTGQVDHKRIDGGTLTLDVGTLSEEVRAGCEGWMVQLEGNSNGAEARNAEQHLLTLVRVRRISVPTAAVQGSTVPNIIVINKTS